MTDSDKPNTCEKRADTFVPVQDELLTMVDELHRMARENQERQELPEPNASQTERRQLAAQGAGRAKVAGTTARPSKERAGERGSSSSLPQGNVVRLPYWPEDKRGVANDMARSALFTVRLGPRREQFKGHTIYALKNIEMMYTGEELRQRDQDVLLQILHFGRGIQPGKPIYFVAYDMLRQLGWSTNSKAYQELDETIARLKSAVLHIVVRSGGSARGFSGSLVQSYAYHREEGGKPDRRWAVMLEPGLARIYSAVSYTQVDWQTRLKLSPMCKWLHAFYATHRQPYPMKVTTIYELCGSNTKSVPRFRQMLKKALTELKGAGFLRDWSLDGKTDLVSVVRNLEGITETGQAALS